MHKFLLISFCAILSLAVSAQEDTKYLAGAVPEVESKVVFSRSINVKSPISDVNLFDLMDKWAANNYVASGTLMNRVLLSDKENKDIACQGETYLVFKKGALVLDQAKMTYQLVLNTEQGKCNVTIRNIKYDYSDNKTLTPAEEMITDKVALNKKGDKLNRYYDKFRRHTIDSINSIFNRIDVYLNGTMTTGAVSAVKHEEPMATTGEYKVTETSKDVMVMKDEREMFSQDELRPVGIKGFKRVAPDKIPGNYVKLLNDWTLITSGSGDQANVMTASWGGLGVFWQKPVAICFLNPSRYSVQVMDKGEYYTISFYTEAYKEAMKYCGSVSGRDTDKIKGSGLTPIKTPSGSTAFSEAWMILECKKIVAQQISPEAVVDKSMPENDWSKNGYHKMYIGEILNVWIK